MSNPKPQVNCRCWDLIVDGDSTIHGNHVVDGNVTVNGNITINGTVDIPSGSIDVGDIVPGPAGNFLVTDSLGTTVIWSSLPPVVIPPGAPDSIFQTNSTGGGTVWNTDLVVPGSATVSADVTVTGIITSTNASVSAVTSSGYVNVVNDLTCHNNIYVDNDVIVNGNCSCTTSISSTVQTGVVNATDDITCGGNLTVGKTTLCNDTLTVTNQSNFNGPVVCTNDITMTDGHYTFSNAGSMVVDRSSTFNGDVTVNSNLYIGGAPGAPGAVVYKTGPTTQAWVQLPTLINSIVPMISYDVTAAAPSAVQSVNNVAVTPITWNNIFLTSYYSYGTSLYTTFSHVTQSSATQWRINTPGLYSIKWRLSMNGVGVTNSQVYSQVIINGSATGPRAASNVLPITVPQVDIVTCTGEYIGNMNNGTLIGVGVFRNIGTNVLSTIPADSGITITLMSTVVQ